MLQYMLKLIVRRFLLLLIIVPCSINLQAINYAMIFPKAYTEATCFLNGQSWMKDSLIKRDIDPSIALALVFPELIRYQELQNKMEVTALKTLYIQYGNQYADFSIGRFQMKPSFAEEIEKSWNNLKIKPATLSQITFPIQDTKENRIQRLIRLDHIQGQLLYLSIFYLVVDHRFKGVTKSKQEKVLLYATAYNSGYNKPISKLAESIFAKTFYTELIRTPLTICYSYADIALFAFWHRAINI